MRHHALVKWEKALKSVLDEVDVVLEKRYGGKYDLHPARRPHGSTSNRSHDGLFDIRGEFTLGLGSTAGRDILSISTLKHWKTFPATSLSALKTIRSGN
ncbi:MAG: hypothetical protein U5N26_07875 [Candidatus Marinimicrobia bacterium]|nr:hypothetical protein [Candidatus Neomarinimicrobiota bacterium]